MLLLVLCIGIEVWLANLEFFVIAVSVFDIMSLRVFLVSESAAGTAPPLRFDLTSRELCSSFRLPLLSLDGLLS